VRWFVFDDETAEVVVNRWQRGAAEILHDHPVDAALREHGSSVVVLPSTYPGRALVARFKMRTPEPVAILPDLPSLSPVKEPGHKPWWRKLVA